MVRRKSSSLNPGKSPWQSSGIHSQRLFQEKIEDFDCKMNGTALGAVLMQWQAQLGQVRLASTSTGCFQVGCSGCWQQPASLRKICYPSCKSLWCLKAMWWPVLTGQASIFNLSNLPLNTITFCNTDQPFTAWSLRSVLNFKFSVLFFKCQLAAWWALSKNCAKWKYFNSNLCQMIKDVSIKGLHSKILVFRVWPLIFNLNNGSVVKETSME